MLSKFIVFVFIFYISLAKSQEDVEMFKKLVGAICVPNLEAEKAKIVAECEKMIPKTVRMKSCI